MEKIIYHGPDAKNAFDKKIAKCFLSYPVFKVTGETSLEDVRNFASHFLVPSFTRNSWIGLGPLDELKSTCYDALLKGLEESVHNVVSWCHSISPVSETIISRMHIIWSYSPSYSPVKRLDENLIENIVNKNVYEILAIFGGDISSEHLLKEISLDILGSKRSDYLISLWEKIRSIENYDFVSEGLKKKLLLATILQHIS